MYCSPSLEWCHLYSGLPPYNLYFRINFTKLTEVNNHIQSNIKQ